MSIVSWYNYNYNFWLQYRFYYELIPILSIDLSQQLFKIDHILFIVASLWIISVLLELTSNVFKCLYYQHTVSFYSQKRCFFRIMYAFRYIDNSQGPSSIISFSFLSKYSIGLSSSPTTLQSMSIIVRLRVKNAAKLVYQNMLHNYLITMRSSRAISQKKRVSS